MVVNESDVRVLITVLGMPRQLDNGFPSWCLIEDPAQPTLLLVDYDHMGYRSPQVLNLVIEPYLDEVDQWGAQRVEIEMHLANEMLGVTPQQSAAMFRGSMSGWDTPGSKLESYWPDGTWKTKKSLLRRLVTLNLPLGERL